MKLAAWSAGGLHFWGVVEDDGLIALNDEFVSWRSPADAIAWGVLGKADRLETRAMAAPLSHDPGEVRWELPLPAPEKILVVEGVLDGAAPAIELRLARSLVAHGQDIEAPEGGLAVAGALVAVIGTGGRAITAETALDHVAALSLGLDGRALAFTGGTEARAFDRIGGFGPWLVPFEGPGQLDGLALSLGVDGETVSRVDGPGVAAQLADAVARVSARLTLTTGDILLLPFSPAVVVAPEAFVEVDGPGLGPLACRISARS